MSLFEKVPFAPPDPILNLTTAFLKDPRPNKVNLGVGIYKAENLKTPILTAVHAAETILLTQERSKLYLPINGHLLYLDKMGSLIFGASFWEKEKTRIASFQSVGGTGGLKLGGTLLKEEAPHPIWLPHPTWQNHQAIFTECGLKVDYYPYYNQKQHIIEFEKLYAHLEKLPEKSIIILHPSCHNPTGSDLNKEQWERLAALFVANQLIPFFDLAYQGFGDGIEEDVKPIRLFAAAGLEMFVAASNAKNFSLYAERAGCLFILSHTTKIAEHLLSRVKQIIRSQYSTPPLHGAEIVAYILDNPKLRAQWEKELKEMKDRINQMRLALWERLEAKRPSPTFHHLKNGKGMFGFFGLEKPQVDKLIAEHGIYMTNEGRINVCGLNRDNIDYVADTILSVCF